MSTELRKQFIDHMTLNGLATNTIKSYVNSVKKLAKHYNCSPDRLTKDEVEQFFRHLILEEKICPSSCHYYLTGIRYFYKHICRWEEVDRFGLPAKRKPRVLPVALRAGLTKSDKQLSENVVPIC